MRKLRRYARKAGVFKDEKYTPFDEKDCGKATSALQHSMSEYVLSAIGCAWDADNPRTQLEPIGAHAYIELHTAKKM